MRLIDAELVVTRINCSHSDHLNGQAKDAAIRIVNNVPTAIEIVRCKDCRHRIDRRLDLGHFMCEMFYGQGDVHDENFCQWGERREL